MAADNDEGLTWAQRLQSHSLTSLLPPKLRAVPALPGSGKGQSTIPPCKSGVSSFLSKTATEAPTADRYKLPPINTAQAKSAWQVVRPALQVRLGDALNQADADVFFATNVEWDTTEDCLEREGRPRANAKATRLQVVDAKLLGGGHSLGKVFAPPAKAPRPPPRPKKRIEHKFMPVANLYPDKSRKNRHAAPVNKPPSREAPVKRAAPPSSTAHIRLPGGKGEKSVLHPCPPARPRSSLPRTTCPGLGRCSTRHRARREGTRTASGRLAHWVQVCH